MEGTSLFTAVSTSARQLYLLLRCISFAPRAEVQITPEGLHFSTEESRVIQGLSFLEKGLFSSFTVNLPHDEPMIPSFEVSLSALLETLQIFGSSEQTSSYKHQNGGISSTYATAFNTPALALGGTCRISYVQLGGPLSITISEAGVTTTCDLTTYEAASNDNDDPFIPLDKSALTLKIIMRSSWLNDAIAELSGTSPTVLILNASNTSAPYFALEGHGGPFGDSTVNFMPVSKTDPTPNGTSSSAAGKKQPVVTEIFSVKPPPDGRGRVKQRYRFELVKKAGRAMALASKVSLRQDRQGVLSMQFMIEVGESGVGSIKDSYGGNSAANASGGGKVSFIDFRFIPLLDEDEEDEESEEGEAENSDGEFNGQDESS